MGKHPSRRYSPHDGKQVRAGSEPESFDTQQIAWALSKADLDGRWGLSNISERMWWDNILPKLQHYETMTWAEIQRPSGGRSRGNNSHLISVECLIRDAKKRLEEINQDDIDELFSLRLQGEHRIYGIRDGRVLKIIWFDPHHSVVPQRRR